MHDAHSTSCFDHLGLDEIEVIRAQAGVSQAELSRRAEINPTTYQRWLKYLHGQPGGTKPHTRTLRVVRGALGKLVDERRAQLDRLAS